MVRPLLFEWPFINMQKPCDLKNNHKASPKTDSDLKNCHKPNPNMGCDCDWPY